MSFEARIHEELKASDKMINEARAMLFGYCKIENGSLEFDPVFLQKVDDLKERVSAISKRSQALRGAFIKAEPIIKPFKLNAQTPKTSLQDLRDKLIKSLSEVQGNLDRVKNRPDRHPDSKSMIKGYENELKELTIKKGQAEKAFRQVETIFQEAGAV